MTTDGDSPKGTDTTNSKGEFEVNLNAPDSSGEHDVKAQFTGDSPYKSSDSSVSITVEDMEIQTQKNTVTTQQQQTDEEETEEQPEEESEEPEEEPEE